MSPVITRTISFTLSLLLLLLSSTLYATTLGKTLLISEVNTSFDTSGEVHIFISGLHFLGKHNTQPYISLGLQREFTVLEITDRRIALVADLPAGDYLLRVSSDLYFKADKTARFDFTIGDTGPPGIAGVPGPSGTPGQQGPGGEPGETGSQGPVGLAGNPGSMGEPGPGGEKGPAGADGATGSTGPRGFQGTAGLEGIQGPPGPAPEFRWTGGALSVGDQQYGFWSGDNPPVDLTDSLSSMHIEQLCMLASYQHLKVGDKIALSSTEFEFVYPLDAFSRICLAQCPVAFSNFINLAKRKTKSWDEIDPYSNFPAEVASTLLSFKQSAAPAFCLNFVQHFWYSKLDEWDQQLFSDHMQKINTTHLHMSEAISLIEGDADHFSYIGNYYRGYHAHPYPAALDELLDINPWTVDHTTWPYPYSGVDFFFKDGWGNNIVYHYGGLTKLSYSLTSKGPDGILGTWDDLRYDSLNGFLPLTSYELFQQEVLAYILDTSYALERIKTALQQYTRGIGGGVFPSSLDPLVSNGLLDELPTDAWLKAIQYAYDGTDNSFTLSSVALDLNLVTSAFHLLDESQIRDYLICRSDEACIKPLQP